MHHLPPRSSLSSFRLPALTISALLWAATASTGAWAAGGTLPAEQHNQGIAYLSGGVDLDESTALKAAMPSYPLVIEVFNSAGGKNEYTASSELTITTPQGKTLFNSTLQGPFALLRIPAGRYDAQVSYEGQSKRQPVEVKSGGSTRSTFIFGKP